MVRFIKFKDFCRVINSSLEEVGIKENDVVFIAGSQSIPTSEEDLYTLRTLFVVCPTKDGNVDTTKFFLVDPKNLDFVSYEEQEVLSSNLSDKFSKTKH